VIGLTGGVASGKSWVAARFRNLGVPLLEADDVGREIVMPRSPALDEIASIFGHDYLLADGNLDRKRMRERIFADEDAKGKLEAITHPRIRTRLREWCSLQSSPYCILAAAILIEGGMDALVDRILVVDSPEASQIERLTQRDGISEGLARQMVAAQAPRSLRLARAHDVLDNCDVALPLEAQVNRLHRLYLRLAAAPRT